jgi:mRNA interferase RelE/StbE
MTFETLYTKTFLKELNELPDKVRKKAESIVFDKLVNQNPFEIGSIEKMKGYKDKYKIRIGDYRIGLTIDKISGTILLQRLVHRRDIYNKFP